MRIRLELRAGEGGDDAKLLVEQQASIYVRYTDRNGLRVEELDQEHG